MPTEGPPPPARAAALVFPGQGGDWTAGIEVLLRHRHHPLVAALANRLGTDHWPELDGLDTRNAQPVIYVAGLVTAEAVDPATIVAVGGHSLGEITAATWAGAIAPEDGLDLMVARAELGRRAHAGRVTAMGAVMRWDEDKILDLCNRASDACGGVLQVAVRNSTEQFVLSGDAATVDQAIALANAEGAVARRLPIDGAYHCELLAPEVPAFAEAVRRAVTADPRVPVVGSTLIGPWTQSTDLVTLLSQSLVLPVDWPRAVTALAATGATVAYDAGPGDTLRRLGRFLPELPVEAVAES